MVFISKIYTKTGDKGNTRLAGGNEVPKDSLRVETYGTVDELNTVVGIVRTKIMGNKKLSTLEEELNRIQNLLFDLGSDLATPKDARWEKMNIINEDDIILIENWIDAQNNNLEPIKSFTLPGGGEANAFLHLARTVCRRAERLAVTLNREEDINPLAVKFLNRLSDYFYLWTRMVAKILNEPEFLWEQREKK